MWNETGMDELAGYQMGGQFDTSWLVIPLYNEEPVIADVVTQARTVFPNIVCVDDGSRDGSGAAALAAGAHVVTHPINLGQGASLRTGLDYALLQAGSEFFVTFDADGQHAVEDAARIVRRLQTEELDVVVGSRFLGGRSDVPALKRLVLKTAVAVENLVNGLHLTDAHNGLRGLNRTAAEQIVIDQDRMAHASEITSQIAKLNLRYAEEPVEIRYTDYSKSKGQSLWNSVNILNDLWVK
jgi:glycosyltransferase involved in cell wall biosynthesis